MITESHQRWSNFAAICRLSLLGPIFVHFVVVFGAGRALLSTPLGPIDDHEYVLFRLLNPSGAVLPSLSDGLEKATSEFGSGRWRPVYQVGRALTTSLIDDAAEPRYVLRLALLVAVVAIFANAIVSTFAVARVSPILKAGLLLLVGNMFLLAGGWSDVVGRLGPQEIFGLTGLALLVSAATGSERYLPGGRIILGVVLACGFKENFAILSLIFLGFIALCQPTFRRSVSFFVAFTVSFASVLVVVISIGRRGSDVYGNDISPFRKMAGLYEFFASPWFASAGIAILLAWFLAEGKFRQKIELIGLIGFVTLFTEWFVYGVQLEGPPRYRIVSACVAVFQVCVLLMVIVRRLHAAHLRTPTRLVFVIIVWLAAFTPIPLIYSEFRSFSAASKEFVSDWDQTITSIEHSLISSESDRFLLIVDLYNDGHLGRYETGLSVLKFLSRGQVGMLERGFFLQPLPAGVSSAGRNVSGLREGLAGLANSGSVSVWHVGSPVVPAGSLSGDKGTMCIHLSTSGRLHGLEKDCSQTLRIGW